MEAFKLSLFSQLFQRHLLKWLHPPANKREVLLADDAVQVPAASRRWHTIIQESLKRITFVVFKF